MKPKLSINLNAVAMLRGQRDLPWPSLTKIGRMALKAGGHGLTVHPRPDQRHIRFSEGVSDALGIRARDFKIRRIKGSHIVTRKLYQGDNACLTQLNDGRILVIMPYERTIIH